LTIQIPATSGSGNADLEEFGELDDADDVDLQAVLADADLEEPDIADVVVADDLAVDEVDGPDGADGGSEPGQPAADGEADGPEAAAGARVVKIAPDAGGEDEEIFVFRRRRRRSPGRAGGGGGATADRSRTT